MSILLFYPTVEYPYTSGAVDEGLLSPTSVPAGIEDVGLLENTAAGDQASNISE